MSGLGLSDRKVRTDVSPYAPPQFRRPARGASARADVERLSRGEAGDAAHPAPTQALPEDEPIRTPNAVTPLKIPLSITARLAAAMGLVTMAAFGLASS